MNNSMKTPLIRLAKREGMDKRTVGHPCGLHPLLALLLGALVIAISGVNPFKPTAPSSPALWAKRPPSARR